MLSVPRFVWSIMLASSLLSPALAHAGDKLALIVGGTAEFAGSVSDTEAAVSKRGYTSRSFTEIQDKDKLLVDLMAAAATAKRGSTVVLFLYCHGFNNEEGNGEQPEQFSATTEVGHGCCLDANCSKALRVDEIRVWAKLVAQRESRAVVLDTSCTGGSTVRALDSIPGVCAIASSTVRTPSIVNWPSMSFPFLDPAITNFDQLAQATEATLLHGQPGRIYQRMFRSGCSKESMERHGRLDMISWLLSRSDLPTLHPQFVKTFTEGACSVGNDAADEFDKLFHLSASSDKAWLHWAFTHQLGRIEKTFRAAGVELPWDQLKSLDDLIGLLRQEYAGLKAAQVTLAKAVQKLNADTRAKRAATVIEKSRLGVVAAQTAVSGQIIRIAPVLGLFEELECEKTATPCRDIEI